MKMSFRWYGTGNDSVSLSDIKQIPGVEEIVWALHYKQPGEIWEKDEIQKVKDELDEYGFGMAVVESVNVHDDIKTAGPNRDLYIENYKQTLRNLSEFSVKVVCYNFMPVFDWTRSDLFHPVGDGSTALYYQKDMIQDDPKNAWDHYMAYTCQGGSKVFTELLKNAGLESPFDEACLRGVCEKICSIRFLMVRLRFIMRSLRSNRILRRWQIISSANVRAIRCLAGSLREWLSFRIYSRCMRM